MNTDANDDGDQTSLVWNKYHQISLHIGVAYYYYYYYYYDETITNQLAVTTSNLNLSAAIDVEVTNAQQQQQQQEQTPEPASPPLKGKGENTDVIKRRDRCYWEVELTADGAKGKIRCSVFIEHHSQDFKFATDS